MTSTPTSIPDEDRRIPLVEPRTVRLVLRQWRDEDWAPFAALNADPEVMRYFPSTLDEQESNAFAYRNAALLEVYGYGLWAVGALDSGAFLGMVGLNRPQWSAPFTPCTEIGWRLARSAWGRGYATEAARAALAVAFGSLGLDEVVSFTTVANTRSRAVMERLGMTRDPAEDFDHPKLDPDSPVRTHVLYRLRADRFDGGRLPASGRLVGPAR
ncbi:MAG TPA: GNAT family N-acetyltransferase [Lapillicoccus sp.]|uniref:GNAT family N-acetyltransferase n=1 Tax=Lapillicoccus sp. TaxID=1909287 RepID=UPI002F91E35A